MTCHLEGQKNKMTRINILDGSQEPPCSGEGHVIETIHINILDGSQEPPCSGEGHVIETIHLFTVLIVDISLVNLG